MKKISLFLALILVLMLPMSSLASVPADMNRQTPIKFSGDLIQSIGNFSDCRIVYSKSVVGERNAEIAFTDGVINKINERILPNGDKIYNITEGNLQNELRIRSDGTLILNGNLVTLAVTSDQETSSKAIGPMVINQPFWSNTCPYGVKTDYTKSAGNSQNANLSMGITAISITESTFIGILGIAVATNLSVNKNLASVAAGGILTGLLTAWKLATPNSNAMSFKTVSYYHKNSTNGIISGLWVKRNDVSYYGNINYSGFLSTKTNYSGTIL